MTDAEILVQAVRMANKLCIPKVPRMTPEALVKEVCSTFETSTEQSACFRMRDDILLRVKCRTMESGGKIVYDCPSSSEKTAEDPMLAERLAETIEAIENQVADRDRQISELRNKLDSLESRLANIETQLADRDLRTFEFRNRLVSLESRLSSLEEE